MAEVLQKKRLVLPTIVQVGRSIFDPVWAERKHINSNSELIHVLQGEVRLETPGQTITGHKGDTLYTPAGMLHRDIFPVGSVYEVCLVNFAWPAEKQMLKFFKPPQFSQISPVAKLRISEDFHCLYRDFQEGPPSDSELIALRLLQILYRLCSEAASALEQPKPSDPKLSMMRRMEIMTRAKQVIHKQLHSPISLGDIAEKVGVSPYYLSHVFSEESGFTLSSYLTNIRMEKAAELFKDQLQSVKKTARAVGFSDSHYFSRVFRAHFGISPSAYRAKIGRRRGK